jgi:cytochrome c oxidase cbb3-type subunit 3
MSEQTKEHLLDHEYDGIRQYDNPPPALWQMAFSGTVAFSVIYYVFFQLGTAGWTVEDAYDNAVARDLSSRFEEIGDLAMDAPTIWKYMGEPEWLKVGAAVYEKNCKVCHGDNGVGVSGPNLTDDRYIRVKKLDDIAWVIDQGAANGAMPAWGTRLHPNEIVLVSAYVANMRGKNLPGKAPEGAVAISSWPEPSTGETSPETPP